MGQKTFPITKLWVLGSVLTLAAMANIVIKDGAASIFNWLTLASGVGLVILSLIAKKLGRIDA